MTQPKILFGSDLHLEFQRGFLHSVGEIPTGDILLLAGDIFTPWAMDDRSTQLAHSFFREVSSKFDNVIMIMGNHEHYYGYFIDTVELINDHIGEYENIVLLNNQTIDIGDVSIFGSTMWTDVKQNDPLVSMDVQQRMMDYAYIRYTTDYPEKIRLHHTITENRFSRKKLTEFISRAEEAGKFPIIMTHHAPSWRCVSDMYVLDVMSYGYANTGLDDLLEIFPEFVWIHGHMHRRYSQRMGNGLVMCNAYGYIGETGMNNFSFKEIKLNEIS